MAFFLLTNVFKEGLPICATVQLTVTARFCLYNETAVKLHRYTSWEQTERSRGDRFLNKSPPWKNIWNEIDANSPCS